MAIAMALMVHGTLGGRQPFFFQVKKADMT